MLPSPSKSASSISSWDEKAHTRNVWTSKAETIGQNGDVFWLLSSLAKLSMALIGFDQNDISHFQMSYSYFCLVRRKFIAKGLHYMLQLCGHEIQFSISCFMYVNHEFWLSISMHVPTLQQWDSIFNYMNYVNHII